MNIEQKAIWNKFLTKVEQRGRVNNNGLNPCWQFLGGASSSGYGQMMINKQAWNTHRLSWWLNNGCPELTKLDIIGHRCDNNKMCCNPEHLYRTDNKGNAVDAWAHGLKVKMEPKPVIRNSEPCLRCVADHTRCEGEDICNHCKDGGYECITKQRVGHSGDFTSEMVSGENNPHSVLTNAKRAELDGKITAGLGYGGLKKLAEEYGISYGRIQQIAREVRTKQK